MQNYTFQNSASIQRIQPMGEQSSINFWLENRVFVPRRNGDQLLYTDETVETNRVKAKIEGILSSNKSISVMDIYAELAKNGFDDRAIYNWSQTEELVNPEKHPILYVIACQFRDEAFVKQMKNFNHGTSGLHIGGNIHLNSNSMTPIPSHDNSTQVNSGPAQNSIFRPANGANAQINTTINHLTRTGIRAPLGGKTAFNLLQNISTNLENEGLDSLSSLVQWAKDYPSDRSGLSEFIYKLFDGHEANVDENRFHTVQQSINDAIDKFTTSDHQGKVFAIREYDVLGELLQQCSMHELLQFAKWNEKPGIPADKATPLQLFSNWLLDLKKNFHDFQPIRDNSWLKSREFAPRPDLIIHPNFTKETNHVMQEITNILLCDKNTSIIGIYEKLAEKGINDYDILEWTWTVSSSNPILDVIARQFQQKTFFEVMKNPSFKKPAIHIVGDVHLSALLNQKTANADDYHQAFIRAGYTETEIKDWASHTPENYTYSGYSYSAFRALARDGAYERASMR